MSDGPRMPRQRLSRGARFFVVLLLTMFLSVAGLVIVSSMAAIVRLARWMVAT